MSFPSFSEWPPIPQRSAPEADFDAKMYALFQHFAVTHRAEMLSFISFLENNSTVIGAALNATTIGLNTPAAGRFTTLEADSLTAALGEDFGKLTLGGSTHKTELRHKTNGDFAIGDGVSEFCTVKDDGKVGVGTASPAARAEIRDTLGVSLLAVGEGSNNNATGNFQTLNVAFTNDVLRLLSSRSASSVFEFMTCRSNGGADVEFVLRGDGNGVCDGSWTGGGADYAEYFEWLDGNPDAEDRRGLSVVLDGDKIRPALAGEQPIGVISANPSVVGDGDIDRWKGKYLRDDFGAYIWEDYEAVSWTETITEAETVLEQATEAQERTREVIQVLDGQAVLKTVTETVQVPLFDELPLVGEQGSDLGIHRVPRMVEVQRETTKEEKCSFAADALPDGVAVPPEAERAIQQRRKLNPEYDPSYEYVPRADRPEWDTVGLMGKLRLRKGQPVGVSWIMMREVSADVEEWLVR